ncbi:hypothetical protein B9479_006579 [Cryptococcus floricola]|uniref:V-SNARE coiled-coil homology domain-containing protein n=1 Tax=Cryptococcus floricola TaxID=2591691 RepID=A0A5D3ASU1_9TREE|nr:hypothetical protein B9479_006579 [Cryptococcus floricola]
MLHDVCPKLLGLAGAFQGRALQELDALQIRQLNDILRGAKTTITHRKTKREFTIIKLTNRPAEEIAFTTAAALQAEIDSTIGQMRANVQMINGRGHAVDSLQDRTSELEEAAQHFKTVGKDHFVKQYYCKKCDAPWARSPEAPHDHETCIRCNAVLVDKGHKMDCPFRWVKQKPL